MVDEIKALSRLQELDTQLDKIQSAIDVMPERDQYEKSSKELIGLLAELESLTANHDDEIRKLKHIEGEIELLATKISVEQGKLYSGKTANPKELMSIQSEIDALNKEKDSKETLYFAQLEIAETSTERLGKIQADIDLLTKQASSDKKAYNQRTADLEAEKATIVSQIDKVTPQISEESRILYEKIRSISHGKAVVQVTHGVCQGCSLEITTEEIGDMGDESIIWRCPHCRRIVVLGD